MNTTELKNKLKTGGLDARLTALYGKEALAAQKARYAEAIAEFEAEFVCTISGFAFQQHGICRYPIRVGIVADDDFAFYRYRGHVV